MSPDNNHIPPSDAAGSVDQATQEEKRIAARRRFLRLGSGSAALVVTIPHRRAFAAKKGVLASNCTSLQGTPDLISAKNKKALEISAMGTPKGAICRRDNVPPAGMCNVYSTNLSKYSPSQNGQGVRFIDPHQLELGCGTVNPGEVINNTVSASYNYRLYEKGYCPLKYQEGSKYGITYHRGLTYWDGNTRKICEAPAATPEFP